MRKSQSVTDKTPAEIPLTLGEQLKLLNPKQRRKALGWALNAEARTLRRAAQRYFRSGGMRHAASVSRGIRGKALRDLSGIVVSTSPRGRKSMYRNRRGQLKPVAMWLDIGTGERKTSRMRYRGAITGRGAVDYVERTELQRSIKRITEQFKINVIKSIDKLYGK